MVGCALPYIGVMSAPTVSEYAIPSGDSGSLTTIEHMRALIQRALRVPLVNGMAHEIALSAPVRDDLRIAVAIRDWLASRFLFVRDPDGIELVREPEYMLRQLESRRYVSGDCDDCTVLGCALAKSVGIPCKIVGIGFRPNSFSHVFGVAYPRAFVRDSNNRLVGTRVPVSLDVVRPLRTTVRERRRVEFVA